MNEKKNIYPYMPDGDFSPRWDDDGHVRGEDPGRGVTVC